ncbi:hypothetical protein [Dyadobacter pollutisoli]|uniref:Uncharacterized protein n=1 Tax=Dyadobacter pollutisoli TaxID=2910158 RepID=A0A9E8NBW0_9BACT|nr:hypothetical protein [Dyadobacter pollutisoli]WAC12448.1 hypothetical protein ON006_00510 [Dyadobacter pollutisoli]
MDDQLLELYRFYFEDLKDLHEGYISFEITMSLAILTVIGWFLTADKAPKFISSHKFAKTILVITIGITAILELFVVYKIKLMADNIYRLLVRIVRKLSPPFQDIIVKDYFEYRLIAPETVFVFYIFHLTLLVVLGIIISKSNSKARLAKPG